MSPSDETRLVPVPASLRRLSAADTPEPEAKTPCVGVASVGDTHFGATQYGDSQVTAVPPAENARLSPDDSPSSSGQSSQSSSSGQGGDNTTRPSKARSGGVPPSPRPWAILLGATLGMCAAFGVFSLQDRGAKEHAAPHTLGIEVEVKDLDGSGLADVPVRVENQVTMTDEVGHAAFSQVATLDGVEVEAKCPSGYSGAPLHRTLSPALIESSLSWSFRLSCHADFSEVSLVVETKGCGKMDVFVDGVLLGTSEEGALRATRKIREEEVVEVRAEPHDERCKIEKVQHVALGPGEGERLVEFSGKLPPRVIRKKKSAASTRPYRL